MFVVEPRYPDMISITTYKTHFAASDQPLQFQRSTSLATPKAHLLQPSSPWLNKVLYRNDNLEDIEQIDAAREQAIQTASRLKEQRMEAKRTTSARLVDGLKRLLFPPPKPPQPDQPL